MAERGHNRRAARRVIDIIHHASTRRSLHCSLLCTEQRFTHPPPGQHQGTLPRALSSLSGPAADPTPTSSPARLPCPCELDLRVKISLHCCLFPCTRLLDFLPSFADTRFYTATLHTRTSHLSKHNTNTAALSALPGDSRELQHHPTNIDYPPIYQPIHPPPVLAPFGFTPKQWVESPSPTM